jgi:hypothetical protein
MGTWGASLYEDDEAADLKVAVSVVCKVPSDGDKLLEYLQEMFGNCDPTSEEGILFWLIVADQFEKRGIHCKNVFSTALEIIASGSDLQNAQECGADEKFIRKRKRVLDDLAARLLSPRPARSRIRTSKPPALVLTEGEVYSFPTMRGRSWNPYRWDVWGVNFIPDGWGALIVLATGRAFDWLPWVALASLTVKSDVKPTLDDALKACLIPHLQTNGAGRFIPKRSHARGLGLELLGHIKLDQELVKPHLSKWPIATAIQYDWTIAYAALSPDIKGVPIGVELSSLLQCG